MVDVQTKDLELDEIPESVQNFRKLISEFKRAILKRLDAPEQMGKPKAQDLDKLHDVTKYIIKFGNNLMNIINTGRDTDNILNSNNISLSRLSREERELCKYYIHVDIYTHTFDLNGHAE
jgi:hypothetical protein